VASELVVQVEATDSVDPADPDHQYHWRPYCRRSTYGNLDLDEAHTGDTIDATPYQVMLAWT